VPGSGGQRHSGALALLAVGPTVAAGRLLGAVVALSTVLPATLTAGAVLEALGAIPAGNESGSIVVPGIAF
jgi:hypothetical protein